MSIVRIRPLTPMHISLTQPSSPRMPMSTPISSIPAPSTVLGALGALLGLRLDRHELCRDAFGMEALKGLISKLDPEYVEGFYTLECNKPLIWGPLVRLESNYYVPLEINKDLILISLNNLKLYIKNAEKGKLSERNILTKAGRKDSRIGIGLMRDRKVVAPGLIYNEDYLFFTEIIEYIYYSNLKINIEGLVRFGGEGGLAEVRVDNSDAEIEKVYNSNGNIGVILTPLLFHADKSPIGVKDVNKWIKEILGIPRGKRLEFKPEVKYWGLGFSEVCKKRRPIFQSLPTGTVVKLEDNPPRSIGILSIIGYGSIIKL